LFGIDFTALPIAIRFNFVKTGGCAFKGFSSDSILINFGNFEDNFPARETIQVSRLPKDANVEISMIAYK
jgi:hypothetical protein